MLAPLLRHRPAVRERAAVRGRLHGEPGDDENRCGDGDAGQRTYRAAVAAPEPIERQPDKHGGERRERPRARQVREPEQRADDDPGAPAELFAPTARTTT